MDMWGIGCVFFEMLSLYPLFPGEQNEISQIEKIFKILGSPPEALLDKWKNQATHVNFDFPKNNKPKSLAKLLSHVSIECVDLIKQLLQYDPDERLTATKARNHSYFKDLREQEIKRYRQANPVRGRDKDSSYDKYKKNRSNYSSDSSVGSNNRSNVNYINININAGSTGGAGNNMSVNINLKDRKPSKVKYPGKLKMSGYKQTGVSDESDVDLPLIMQKKDYIVSVFRWFEGI